MPLTLAASRLKKPKKTRTGIVACCPAHKDDNPSLSIDLAADGKILVKCHAGCSQDAVIASLKDIGAWPEETPPEEEKWSEEASWIYHDEITQNPALRVRRFRMGAKKRFVQEHAEGTEWAAGRGISPIAPLGWNDLALKKTIFLVEGEKCVDEMRRRGYDATCFPGGSSAWNDKYGKFFKSKIVYLLPDNDTVGHAYMTRAQTSITRAGGKCHYVKLPLENEGDDVVDYFKIHTTEEFDLELESAAKPPLKSNIVYSREAEDLLVKNQEAMLPFGIKMLDDALDGLGDTDLLLMSGKSGYGKTQLATNVALNICKQKKRVFFFALEARDKEIELRMRYQLLSSAYYADPSRTYGHVHWREWIHGRDEATLPLHKYAESVDKIMKQYEPYFFTHYREDRKFDIKDFEAEFMRVKDHVDLIVIDHLNYFDMHDEKKNENKQVEEMVKKIRDCVLIAKTPVILLVHVRKKDGRSNKIIEDMEDLHGTSNIYKIATKVAIVGQEPSNEDDPPYISRTLLRFPKDRDGDVVKNFVFRSRFDIRTRTYEDKYQIGRLGGKEQNEFVIAEKNLPYWYQGSREEVSPL